MVVVIVVIVSAALLSSFITCLALNETSRNMTIAMNIARDKIEEIVNKKLSKWDDYCPTGCAGGTLSAYGLDGSCSVEVTQPEERIKLIRVVVCWKQKGNRIIGEDGSVDVGHVQNGRWDSGEDTIANGLTEKLDSPVVVETAIVKPT